MKTIRTSLQSFARELSMIVAPQWVRTRQFARIDHPTKEAIRTHAVEPEMFLLPALLATVPTTAFIDVGANVGEYMHIAAQHIPESMIYGFEPQSQYVHRLRKLFAHAHVEEIALSSAEGSANLKVPEMHGKSYPTRGTLEVFKEKDESSASYQSVPLTTFDAYWEAKGSGAVGIIKIDVEGHEESVLKGAEHVILRDKPLLIVEIEQRQRTAPIDEMFNYIKNLGYTGFFFSVPTNSVRPLTEFSLDTHQQLDTFKTSEYVNNFIFVPLGSAAESIVQTLSIPILS